MHSKLLISAVTVSILSAASATPLFAEDIFPIEHGRYIEAHYSCDDLERPWSFIYDGSEKIRSSKSSCAARNISKSRNIYEYEETCYYYHTWLAIFPSKTTEWKNKLEVLNRREFLITRETEGFDMREPDRYRWCGPE